MVRGKFPACVYRGETSLLRPENRFQSYRRGYISGYFGSSFGFLGQINLPTARRCIGLDTQRYFNAGQRLA